MVLVICVLHARASLVAWAEESAAVQWFAPCVGKIPLEKGMAASPVFLSGESQRSLVEDSPWGRKESDTTERLTPQSLCAMIEEQEFQNIILKF